MRNATKAARLPTNSVDEINSSVYSASLSSGFLGTVLNVAAENNRLRKKLKPLIRFVKTWKYYCNVPISSFYLELRVTKWMESEDTIVYDIDLKKHITETR